MYVYQRHRIDARGVVTTLLLPSRISPGRRSPLPRLERWTTSKKHNVIINYNNNTPIVDRTRGPYRLFIIVRYESLDIFNYKRSDFFTIRSLHWMTQVTIILQ